MVEQKLPGVVNSMRTETQKVQGMVVNTAVTDP